MEAYKKHHEATTEGGKSPKRVPLAKESFGRAVTRAAVSGIQELPSIDS
jgi:aspartate oxidase